MKFRGHRMTSSGLRDNSFRPNIAVKSSNLKKIPKIRKVPLRILPLIFFQRERCLENVQSIIHDHYYEQSSLNDKDEDSQKVLNSCWSSPKTSFI